METHQVQRGRLIDHVQLIARDLAATRRFYAAVLAALGRKIAGEGDGYFWSDELFVSDASFHPSGATHVRLAFQAPDRATVHRFYEAALAAGGRDNGAPGLRTMYHPDYCGAFVLDSDSNNIEAVWHGLARRSADAVVISF